MLTPRLLGGGTAFLIAGGQTNLHLISIKASWLVAVSMLSGNQAWAGCRVPVLRDLRTSPVVAIITVSGAVIVVIGILLIAMSFTYAGLLMAGLGVLLEALGYLAIRS
jgi:hypothetical protein